MFASFVPLCGQDPILLDRALMVIGRNRGCHIRIESRRVSRYHCCIAVSPSGVIVKDLASVNGTRINGQRIDEGRLRDGDEFAVAQWRYRCNLGTLADSMIEGMPSSALRDLYVPGLVEPTELFE